MIDYRAWLVYYSYLSRHYNQRYCRSEFSGRGIMYELESNLDCPRLYSDMDTIFRLGHYADQEFYQPLNCKSDWILLGFHGQTDATMSGVTPRTSDSEAQSNQNISSKKLNTEYQNCLFKKLLLLVASSIWCQWTRGKLTVISGGWKQDTFILKSAIKDYLQRSNLMHRPMFSFKWHKSCRYLDWPADWTSHHRTAQMVLDGLVELQWQTRALFSYTKFHYLDDCTNNWANPHMSHTNYTVWNIWFLLARSQYKHRQVPTRWSHAVTN